MDRNFERRWKMINQALDAGFNGTEMQPVVSKRTLFGIPSSVEQGIEKIIAEDEEKYRKIREEQRKQDGE